MNFTEVSFNWDPTISHQCSDVLYKINATNCGMCPINISLTTATCIVVQDETANYSNLSCIFAIQTLIHGSVVGHQTILLSIKLSGNYCKCVRDQARVYC